MQSAAWLVLMKRCNGGARPDFYMSLYNVVFTMAAPLVVGTINQDVNCATSRAFPGTVHGCVFVCHHICITCACGLSPPLSHHLTGPCSKHKGL